MTAPPRQREHSNWPQTAIRRMIGALRYTNEELLHAHEAMARPAGASGPGPRAAATGTAASSPAGGAGVRPRQRASAAEGGKPAA